MMNARPIEQAMTGVAAVVLVVSAVWLVLSFSCGCTPAETNHLALSVENSLAVAQYDAALVACQQAARQRPREQRFEAYTDCEQETTKQFCAESEELRKHWSRCADLDAGEE